MPGCLDGRIASLTSASASRTWLRVGSAGGFPDEQRHARIALRVGIDDQQAALSFGNPRAMLTAIDRASVVFPTPPFMVTTAIVRTGTPPSLLSLFLTSALVTQGLE